MTVTRREAVRLGAASAATAAVAAGLVGGADSAAAAVRPARRAARGGAAVGDLADGAAVQDRAAGEAAYRLAFWRGLVGSRVGLADRSASFLVLRVQDMTTSRATARTPARTAGAGAPNLAPSPRRPARAGEAFAIRLRGAGAGLPSDRVLRLSHPSVGHFDLFITSTDPVSHDYVAVVNRRLPVA